MILCKKVSGRDVLGYLLLAISAVMLFKSAALCFSNDIWYDELFTVGMAEHSYGELVRFTAADVHPPLYYCIVKFFADLCKLILPSAGTVIPAKLVSVLPYFILLVYAVTWVRGRWGVFTGGLFLFCVTAMPQLSAYTVEARMYGWALLFVTAAFLHADALTVIDSGGNAQDAGITRRKTTSAENRQSRLRFVHGAALVFYGLAAAYTQYFACVAVVMVYLYLLFLLWRQDRGRIKEWLFCAAASAFGYVPWLFALAGQISAVRENYWILPLTWRSLGGCVKFIMKPAFRNDMVNTVLAVVLTAGFGVVFLWCGWQYKLGREGRVFDENVKERRFITAAAGIWVLAGVVGFGFAASLLIRPIFVYRYMIPALGCFWLSFALCMDEILCKPKGDQPEQEQTRERETDQERRFWLSKDRWFFGGCLAFIGLVVAVGLRDYRAFMGEEEYKIVMMRETETALSLIGPEDTVLYNFDQVQAVTGYYLPETVERLLWRTEGEKLIQEITSPCGQIDDVEEIRQIFRQAQSGMHQKNLWFIGSFNSRDGIVDEWREDGLYVEEMGSFLLERYWFNLYRISDSDHTTF